MWARWSIITTSTEDGISQDGCCCSNEMGLSKGRMSLRPQERVHRGERIDTGNRHFHLRWSSHRMLLHALPRWAVLAAHRSHPCSGECVGGAVRSVADALGAGHQHAVDGVDVGLAHLDVGLGHLQAAWVGRTRARGRQQACCNDDQAFDAPRAARWQARATRTTCKASCHGRGRIRSKPPAALRRRPWPRLPWRCRQRWCTGGPRSRAGGG